MAKITVAKELCKACELCIDVCPKHLIQMGKELNKKEITMQNKLMNLNVPDAGSAELCVRI